MICCANSQPVIWIGETPTFNFKVNGVNLENVNAVNSVGVFKCGNSVLNIPLSNSEKAQLNTEYNIISIGLDSNDTKMLSGGAQVNMQILIEFNDGSKSASNIVSVPIKMPLGDFL